MNWGLGKKSSGYAVVILLLAMFSLPLFSQTSVLKGRVTDSTGNGLPKASVKLLDGVRGNSKGNAEAVTGPEGQFQLTAAGNGQFVLQVEALGFRSVTRMVTVGAVG